MVVAGPVGGCISIAVLASAYVCGSRRYHRTTLQGTGASQMNATDVMLAEPGTAQSESMADETCPLLLRCLASTMHGSLRLSLARPTC